MARRLAGCFRSGRYAPSDRYLIRPPPSGCFQPAKSCRLEGGINFLAPVATLPPTAILYALLRRAGSALRGLGLLVAPLLLRPAPRCSCMVVVIHKASIRKQIGTSHTPGRGKGVGCLMRSVVARRWASKAFFTPFGQCLRSPPPCFLLHLQRQSL